MACKKYTFDETKIDEIYKITKSQSCAYDTKGRIKPGQCRTVTTEHKCSKDTFYNEKGKAKKYECKHNKYNDNQEWFDKCCVCATKKGGALDLSIEEANNLKKQLSGENTIPTQIIYGGAVAEVVKINKETKTLEILADNNIHNINLYDISVNGKYIL